MRTANRPRHLVERIAARFQRRIRNLLQFVQELPTIQPESAYQNKFTALPAVKLVRHWAQLVSIRRESRSRVQQHEEQPS